jgi:hypothetical protein
MLCCNYIEYILHFFLKQLLNYDQKHVQCVTHTKDFCPQKKMCQSCSDFKGKNL